MYVVWSRGYSQQFPRAFVLDRVHVFLHEKQVAHTV